MSNNYNVIGDRIYHFYGAILDNQEAINQLEEEAVWRDNQSTFDAFGPTRKDTTLEIYTGRLPWSTYVAQLEEVINTYARFTLNRDSVSYVEKYDESSLDVFHFSKYRVGGGVGVHSDEDVTEDNGEVTVIWYLNDEYDGGEVGFEEPNVLVKPRGGDIFIFPTYKRHWAESVKSGVKYLSIRRLTI